MVSEKSRPIKKVKFHEAHEHSHHARKEKTPVWMYASIVLGILLVVSVFTNGFRFNKIESAENELSSLLSKETSIEAKAALSQALSSLQAAKSLMAEKSSDYSGKKVKLDF